MPWVKPNGPDFGFSCCTKECHRHFDEALVNEFRREIWTGGFDSTVVKEKIWDAHAERFKRPDGRKCCVRFLCEAANCSRNLLYAPSKGDKALTNSARSRADVAIMAWFQSILPIIDQMPDTGWYVLNAMNKRTVFEWYMDDSTLFPQVFAPCKSPGFVAVEETLWQPDPLAQPLQVYQVQ